MGLGREETKATFVPKQIGEMNFLNDKLLSI